MPHQHKKQHSSSYSSRSRSGTVTPTMRMAPGAGTTSVLPPTASVPVATAETPAVSPSIRPAEQVASERSGEESVIRVVLADDHTLMREGLRHLLELESDLKVVGEAADGPEALRVIRQLCPDVVLLDISMPQLDGLALTRQLAEELPQVAIIILTMHRQHPQVLRAIKNGARGYLLKSASSQELIRAIRTVHAGGALIEPELTGPVLAELRRLSQQPGAPGAPTLNDLTEKEIEIIRYVAQGMSNREIAAQLSYSEKTVKNYLSVIFQKLGIRDRTQAAIFGLRQGLLADEGP
ncbi:response regulator transcription factor [Thermogemmatispora carboxidivorans]|uniref:response regulator transcription factor n=1 Tax=Thermogemmatispora carboxidivorans TaxID=1382306 RepID=UPI00192E44B1|nr:response regulator transcription factor [Thermogemmatispora carboxidivorans]